MNLPINIFMWLLAFLPIAVLLVLMIKFNWGAKKAAPVGLVITIATGMIFYKANVSILISESIKGVWNAFVIILIVFTAILLYQVAVEANAFHAIRNGMSKLIPNELLLILAMGWVFESFLQGITGFGVPVAVGAPLLIGVGVMPMWAVIVPLFGQAWGNTFGTLGAAWDALAMSAGLAVGSPEYWKAALWSGIFLWVWNFIIGMTICWFYGKGRAIKKGLLAVIVISLVQGGGQLFFTQLNTTISCFVPACIALVLLLILSRLPMYREKWSLIDSPIMIRTEESHEEAEDDSEMTLVQAFVPYVVLTAVALIVLLVPAINEALTKIALSLDFPETTTGYGVVNAAVENYSPFRPFTHASMFLLISAIAGYFYFRSHGWIEAGKAGAILKRSIKMTIPSSLAVLCLIIMSKIMGGTGQTIVLAEGISNVLGKGYAILAPIVGLLGSFMTGSNMSSNILFGDFQVTTASFLKLNAAAVLGAQTGGAAIGCAISPSNIVLGTTTANILGNEGQVLKKILPITIVTALFIGVILFVTVALV